MAAVTSGPKQPSNPPTRFESVRPFVSNSWSLFSSSTRLRDNPDTEMRPRLLLLLLPLASNPAAALLPPAVAELRIGPLVLLLPGVSDPMLLVLMAVTLLVV